MSRLLLSVLEWPRATLALCALVTLVLGLGALRLELRTDGQMLMPEGHPVVERGRQDELRFRDPRELLLVVDSTAAETSLSSPQGFRFLRSLHARLQRLDVLRPTGLVSIASLPRLVRGGGGVTLGTYLDAIPDHEAGFAALLASLRQHPASDGLLLSRDGRRALFSLPVSERVSVQEAVSSLERFCAEAADARFALILGGPLVAETTLGEKVLRDLALLVPLMLAVMVLLLYAMLRSPAGVMIPMLEMLIVLIWTFGAMGWFGAPIALVTTILPVVLMAMCISDEIHLLERLTAHGQEPDMRQRLRLAMAEVARPIVLTSLTTAAGFLSFTSASIVPLREFGFFAAFGILAAMLLTFTLIPALIVVLPRQSLSSPRGRGLVGRGLMAFGSWAARAPGSCFALGMLAFLMALPGLQGLRVSDSWVGNFDPQSSIVSSERAINESFWGSYRLDVVLDASPGFFMRPQGVALSEAIRELALQAPHVGGVESYLIPLQQIARSLDVAAPLSRLPADQLWDVFALAEMSESRATLNRLMTGRGATLRIRLYVKSPDYARARELERHLDERLTALLTPLGVEVHYSGDLPLASALVEAIVYNQLRSIAWAVVIVALLLVAFSRRLSSLWALAPVLASSGGLFGLMGSTGIELGIATSMFASLAIGVGVDFGIHFMHRFELERGAGLSNEAATRATFAKVGRALFWNTATLSAGFLVLVASSLKPNHTLGLLLAAATLFCLMSSFLFLPFLLRGRARKRPAAAAMLTLPILTLLLDADPLGAQDFDCSAPRSDLRATQLMAGLEAIVRGVPRISRMHISTEYPEGSRLAAVFERAPIPKTLWGVVNGDSARTRMLFVFSGPGRMAGTGLLLEDFANPSRKDGTWFYLRAFENFSKLEGAVERSMIPGTALTYEDARGYVDITKYRFRSLVGTGGEPTGRRRILACPTNASVAERLGYSALVVEVDPQRQIVAGIEYRGPGGGLLKSYRLKQSTQLDGRTFPAQVLLEHHVDGYRNHIQYEYWMPRQALSPSLFRASVDQETFLARLQKLLDENGLTHRIASELDEADQRVRVYEERMRQIEEERSRGNESKVAR